MLLWLGSVGQAGEFGSAARAAGCQKSRLYASREGWCFLNPRELSVQMKA